MSDKFDDFSDYYEEYDDSYDGLEASPPAEAWDEDDLIAGVREGAVAGDTAVGDGDKPKSNRLKIILGVIFVIFVLPLLCFLCFFLFSGAAIFSALLNIDEADITIIQEGAEGIEGVELENTPIATFVPTAAVIIPPTASPEPTLPPTPVPASVTFLSPADNTQITLGEPIEIIMEVTDPNGLTYVGFSELTLNQRYSGETEVTFNGRWVPENPGQYNLNVVIRNRANNTPLTLEGITVTVITGEEDAGNEEEEGGNTEEGTGE